MYKNCLRAASIAVGAVFLLLLTALLAGSILRSPRPETAAPVQRLEAVTAQIGEVTEQVTLPHSFRQLAARTPVCVTMTITPQSGDYLYLKSVYAPLKVYANGVLLYEYGQDGTYPSFMQDPATNVELVPLSGAGEPTELRLEYLSPSARDVLTVHPVLLGGQAAIFGTLFDQMGAPFLFAIIQLFCGLFLVLVALFVMPFEQKGIAFLWLGAFAAAAGSWSLGENNLTGAFIQNPTLLYIMAFAGMICFAVPLIYFGLTMVDFHHRQLLRFTALVNGAAAAVGLLLQLFGLVSLSRSMYIYHILVPISLCVFAALMLHEAIRYKNKAAIRFTLPMGVLAASVILELVNYQVRFTDVLTSFFQMGVLLFILITGVVAGLFVRDAMNLRAEKQQLEFEVSLMEAQVAQQKKHHQLLLENAAAIKAQRHDLRHQLAVLRSYSEDADSAKLTGYINTLIADIPAEQGSYCENAAVNAIVSHYAGLAKKNGIALSIKLTVPAHTEQITDASLCVLFGNLLENAIEACARMTEGEKFIRLHSRLQFDTLTITMDNSFDGKVARRGERFVSSKRNELGTGLASITAVAEKRGGGARFEAKGLVFLSSVYVTV